jgi:hypothetical protein
MIPDHDFNLLKRYRKKVMKAEMKRWDTSQSNNFFLDLVIHKNELVFVEKQMLRFEKYKNTLGLFFKKRYDNWRQYHNHLLFEINKIKSKRKNLRNL